LSGYDCIISLLCPGGKPFINVTHDDDEGWEDGSDVEQR
jgi:hypothetical protein